MIYCKICRSETTECFSALVLKKYKVKYHKCTNCDFIQTDDPFWLEEAYNNAITNQDIGLVNRNLIMVPIISSLLGYHFNKKGRFIDYGGGYGLLTRIMRDKGFDYYRFDTYCANIFAKNFDCPAPGGSPDYELLTAFEVFEHLADPVAQLAEMLKWSTNIFFSTELQPANLSAPDDWWYVIPETGQHIALYTIKALQHLGKIYGLNFYTNGINFHLFTKGKISPGLFKFITKYKIARLIDMLTPKNESLMMHDFEMIKKLELRG